MANKEKKLSHIQVKDNGIKLSNKVGDVLNDAKQILQKNLFEGLLESSNETNITRYKIAQNNAFRDYSINTRKTIEKAKTEVKTALKQDSSVNLKNNQVNRMSADVNKGLLFLQQDAIKTYQSTLRDVLLHVKAASDLKEQLAKHIESGLNLGVVYKDGKNYSFDSYFEMKARTDIQQDIGKNMIAAGQENGVIFYITSFYGDCAPDHADYQGKIYVDEKWESMCPKDRLEEVRNYIDSNKLMTVQEVSEKDPFLTTRPNCRHYFQYISIDEVLGAKTQDDVKDLRQERGLNFGGKYQPDKYKALQQQRANERKIRAEKANVQSLELQKQLEPDNKNLQIMINNSKSNIRAYQANQRELEKQYSNIERRYDREALGNRVTLGTEYGYTPDLISEEINDNIEVEEPLSEEIQYVEDTCKTYNVDYLEVKELKESITQEEIINKLGGGDKTGGSCVSLSWSYAANKLGLDVTDFRGGNSQEVFSKRYISDKISSLGKCFREENTNDFKSAVAVLKQAEVGKEYILFTGEHAAIVRRLGEKGFEYLELQSNTNNGFKNLTTNVLKDRFGCKKSHSVAGLKLQYDSRLVEIDSLKENKNQFKKILGYLNTKSDNQNKGSGGHEK